MQFDDNVISDFKQIINDELAYGIFLHDWAIRKDIENHISTMLFQSPPHMKETVLKLLQHHIERAKTKSILGFTEDDPALITTATWIALKTGLPFYPFYMQDEGAFSQFIEPANCPCSLLIPYSANDIQINEIIRMFTDKKIPIKQVIALVEEQPLKTDFQKLGVDYVNIANWVSIKEKIKTFRNIMPEKMSSVLSIFE